MNKLAQIDKKDLCIKLLIKELEACHVRVKDLTEGKAKNFCTKEG